MTSLILTLDRVWTRDHTDTHIQTYIYTYRHDLASLRPYTDDSRSIVLICNISSENGNMHIFLKGCWESVVHYIVYNAHIYIHILVCVCHDRKDRRFVTVCFSLPIQTNINKPSTTTAHIVCFMANSENCSRGSNLHLPD